MDGHIRKLVEKEKEELDKLNEKRLIKEKSLKKEIQLRDIKRNIEELEKEEEKLKTQLEKVKKENFSLRASVNAWQSVRKKKIDEFKQAQLDLNELYKEIWKGREEFCSKADEFNNEFGILSNWWKSQMEYVNDAQNFEGERTEYEKYEDDIEQLRKEIADLKKEIETLSKEQEGKPEEIEQRRQPQPQHKEEDSSIIEETKPTANTPTNKTTRKDDETNFRGKKVKFSEMEDVMEVISQETVTPNNELYSLMDINKMKMANHKKKAFRSKLRRPFN